MRRPNVDREKMPKVVVRTCNGVEVRDSYVEGAQLSHNGGGDSCGMLGQAENGMSDDGDFELSPEQREQFSPLVIRAIEGVRYIAAHLKEEDDAANVS